MRRMLLQFALPIVWIWGLLIEPALAATNTRADLAIKHYTDQIGQFNMEGYSFTPVYEETDSDDRQSMTTPVNRPRRTLGSALSPNIGSGIGVSVATTWHDQQVFYPVGRHVSHYWNGSTGEDIQVEVHFVYEMTDDTSVADYGAVPNTQTGYNVYDGVVPTGNWPRGQDIGCALQSADSIGSGLGGNMVVRPNGLVTLIAASRFFAGQLAGGEYYEENILYFQGSQFNCTYDPRSSLNVTFVDSLKYKPLWAQNTNGNHSRYPSVSTQLDGGGNVITHVLLAEETAFEIQGNPGYANDVDYRTFAYFRKSGSSASGVWSSGVIIDTIERNFADMVSDPWSGRVCIAYSNPSYYGRLLNNGWDKDCYYRESLDFGLTWQPKMNITNHLNAVVGTPHYALGYECRALYSSDGNLHILFQQTPASADPYFDGFAWDDYNQDLAHWDRNSGDYVRVANGTYMNDDYLTGSINTVHCGFGGDPAAYIQFFNLSECDGKLFAVWNQIHSWANEGDYRLNHELLEDCAYTGSRTNMANWEILMSVANINSPTLWDPPRRITNTFTPECGLPGDPEAAGGLCGNEYKPYVEHYGLDEAGMDLTWPSSAVVDMTPEGDPAYAGNFYLNAEYIDDQMPGPAWEPLARDPNGFYSLNSMKWLRIACVEPVEASVIEVHPRAISFPVWVEFGTVGTHPITVVNSGNVTLNVSAIGCSGGGWLSASETPSVGSPFQVPAGVVNTATFDILINATAISTTQWLDGIVWLKSDAANTDSLAIGIHVLAANHVEAAVWDTVTTHKFMFDTFFEPEGECVALAVSNFGEIGYGARSNGGVNLDFSESGTECGSRERDKFYLFSGTAFAITAASSAGSGAELSMSYNDADQTDETGFDPTDAKGSIRGGSTASGDYDSVYTGRFVNRDTTIALERFVYGPRSETPTTAELDFLIVHTKVYSADGAAHSHVTIGNACDFDVPADSPPNNNSGVSGAGFVYFQGTDTSGSSACQTNLSRYATEAFGGGYTSWELQMDPCVNNATFYGQNSLCQHLMVDTTHYRDGTDLVPDQANPLVWWTETGVPGINASDLQDTDLALISTYVQDYYLGASDTLHYWTVMSTVRSGTLADLEAQVQYAKEWYSETVRGCEAHPGCCIGEVGDANGSGDECPTIGDISVMIDAKFISGVCIAEGAGANIRCLGEADMNLSGGADPTCEDISIGDISTLIDDLFITGEPPFVRNSCANKSGFDRLDYSSDTRNIQNAAAQTHVGIISIDNTSNEVSQTQLRAGSTHTVSLRYDFTGNSNSGYWMTANAWELFSPDGADWVNLAAADGPLVVGLDPNIARFRKYYTSSNAGYTYTQTAPGGTAQPGGNTGPNSRVAYSFAILDEGSYSGFVGGVSNGIAVTLEFQTLLSDLGKHICLDTLSNCSVVIWEWAAPVVGSDWPQWDNGLGISGPRCWEIVDASVAPLGDAEITQEGECINVSNIGASGNDGVRVYPEGIGEAGGIRADMANVLLDDSGDGVNFQLRGYVTESGKSDFPRTTTLQEVGMAGVTNVNGQIQITANFNPIGDPNVELRAWVLEGSLMSGKATVPGGGVIAQGTATTGSASVVSVAQLANNPPSFSIRFDRLVQFNLASSPPVQLTGEEIHLVAVNATESIEGLGPADVTGEYIGWFGLCGMKTNACCLGFTGNANMDPTDGVTIGDISVMIDNLFISGTPLSCLEEADVNLTGTLLNPPLDPEDITIGDITILIDHLFISQIPTMHCP